MTAVILVCHHGELELKSAFLIYSLRKYLKGNYSIYVGIPTENRFISKPTQEFFKFCREHDVELYNFKNPYLDAITTMQEGDLISNKIFACLSYFKEEFVVFFDSDTVLIRDFNIDELVLNIQTIGLKPANRANIKHWGAIYKDAGLPKPTRLLKAGIDKTDIPPYFNSGVLVMKMSIAQKLIESWLRYFIWLSDKERINKLGYPVFHRDQIALALAIVECKIEYSQLDEKYNFPVRGKKISVNSLPNIVHYHNPYSIYFEKPLKREFQEFISKFPACIDKSPPIWIDLFGGNYLKEKHTAGLEFVRFSKYHLTQKIKKLLFSMF